MTGLFQRRPLCIAQAAFFLCETVAATYFSAGTPPFFPSESRFQKAAQSTRPSQNVKVVLGLF